MYSKALLTTAFTAALFANKAVAGYTLEDDYNSGNWNSMFSYFDSADPTNGFVNYVDQSAAQNDGMVEFNGGSVYMGVDHTNVASSAGRNSVRITSNKSYQHGLFILDLTHMPEGCGTWPAFWLVGSNWPNNGEIDIIEGVNAATTNSMTLHTASGCTITNNNEFLGTIETANCYVDAAGQSNNAGCGESTTNTQTYGPGFNAQNGGVYATEWTSDYIKIWFFPRSSIPSDISSGNPTPSNWGMPTAMFQGGCNIDSYFNNQQIVFDTTFCGDWAGAVWSTSTCASQASTCNAFVQNNPSAFSDAYWNVTSLKVYTESGSSSPASSSVPATTFQTSTYLPSSTWTSVASTPSSTFTSASASPSTTTTPSSTPAASSTKAPQPTWSRHSWWHQDNAVTSAGSSLATAISSTTSAQSTSALVVAAVAINATTSSSAAAIASTTSTSTISSSTPAAAADEVVTQVMTSIYMVYVTATASASSTSFITSATASFTSARATSTPGLLEASWIAGEDGFVGGIPEGWVANQDDYGSTAEKRKVKARSHIHRHAHAHGRVLA